MNKVAVIGNDFSTMGRELARALAAVGAKNRFDVHVVGQSVVANGSIEPFEVLSDSGRVSAEQIRWQFKYGFKPGSRRGRNLKPDESRKARYSEARNRG